MSRLEAVLLQLQCTAVLPVDKNAKGKSGTEADSLNLEDLRDSKKAVYDFWTTRCVNCPAALDRLDDVARQRPSVKFVAVNIDDLPKAKDLATRAASEGRWTSLVHAHLAEAEKERAKEFLGMKRVPFYVIVGQDGEILRHGNAKTVSLDSVASLDAVLSGRDSENDPAVANTSPKASDTRNTSSTPSVECEGGVCKLVRKKKPDVSEDATAATAEKDDTVPVTHAVHAPAVDRTMDCEGEVCKLMHKKGGESGGVVPATPKASAESQDSTVAGGGPHAVARSMECEDGVCKLVRKQKNAGVPNEEAERAAKEEDEVQESLRVGDVMPSLGVVMLEGEGETKGLYELTAGRPAVLDFWTTKCFRCPAALDALEALATHDSDVIYVSLNLDDLKGAREAVSKGRWPSVSHAFVGRHEDLGQLESFKVRAGLKSVPFYVTLAGDGRINQIGGPKEVKLGKAANDAGPAPAAGEAPSLTTTQAPEPAPKAFAFTIDEDF